MSPRRFRSVPLESEEQKRIVALLDAVGFVVCSFSQSRASMQTPGILDLYAVHPGIGVACWFDAKRQKGARVSPMQEQFQIVHHAATMAAEKRAAPWGAAVPDAVIGTAADAERLLERCGLAERTITGQFILRPCKVAAYHEWHRVRLETQQESQLRRRRRGGARRAQVAQ